MSKLPGLTWNRRTFSINFFLNQTNLLYQTIIYWSREHLTKHLSIGNLKGVSFLSICCLSGRYWRGMSPGALCNIETDEICLLFIVCAAKTFLYLHCSTETVVSLKNKLRFLMQTIYQKQLMKYIYWSSGFCLHERPK